ncbi:MAG: exodeoxyribonuclease VII small subunit [Chloroflexi bacterium]|nr:exodeoxyribonuclease VII small subunit [Chloroflexota bacterium]MDA1218701.1 exodeoxyribonuclease VII small subunit [Chloroflexota bacterium]
MPRPKKNQSGTDLETMTFEDAFRRLGETAEALEAGGLPLAEATAVYEQGMALVQRCNQLLNETELKITRLKESYTGSTVEEVLEWDDEETDA